MFRFQQHMLEYCDRDTVSISLNPFKTLLTTMLSLAVLHAVTMSSFLVGNLNCAKVPSEWLKKQCSRIQKFSSSTSSHGCSMTAHASRSPLTGWCAFVYDTRPIYVLQVYHICAEVYLVVCTFNLYYKIDGHMSIQKVSEFSSNRFIIHLYRMTSFSGLVLCQLSIAIERIVATWIGPEYNVYGNKIGKALSISTVLTFKE